MLKKKRNKKAISNLLVILMFITLGLLLIVIVWNLVFSQVSQNLEITEKKSELFMEKITIEDVIFNEGETTVDLKLKKGSGRTVQIQYKQEVFADIVFLIDSTGSMGEEINDVKNTVIAFADALGEKEIDYRLALVEFKDYKTSPCGSNTDFPSKTHKFSGEEWTNNIEEYKSRIGTLVASGGNDLPESHLTAIKNANGLDFRDIPNKFVILFTDAMPHAQDCYTSTGASTYKTCHTGPKQVSYIEGELLDNEVIFYYVNKNEGLCNNQIMKNMAYNTGGNFFSYTEAQGVEDIILNIAEDIKTKSKAIQVSDYIKVMFYFTDESCERRVYDLPETLESKKL
ncbi:MAG: vWA domain-containing protein [archaeon]